VLGIGGGMYCGGVNQFAESERLVEHIL